MKKPIGFRKMVRPPHLLILVLVLTGVLFALMTPTIQVGSWEDDGTYILMARSLLQGRGMHLIYLPTDPLYPIVPTGYPLVLSPFLAAFPESFLPLQLLSSAFLLVTVMLVYRYARPRLGEWPALAAAALFGVNLAVVQSAAQVMSEALALLTIMIALVQTERFVDNQQAKWYDVPLTATLVALPASVRYLGLPIVAALLLYVLVRRHDRVSGATVALGVVLVLFLNVGLGGIDSTQYWVDTIMYHLHALVGSGSIRGSAVEQVNVAARFGNNVWVLLTNPIPSILIPLFDGPQIRSFFSSMRLGFIPYSAQILIDIVLFGGFTQQVRRRARASEWAIAAYAITLFLYPVDWATFISQYRYWIPLTLFGYMYLISALRGIYAFAVSKIHLHGPLANPNGLVIVVVACMLALNIGRDIQMSLISPLRSRIPDLAIGSAWIKVHSGPADVIMVQKPRAYTLYLDREVVPYPDPYACFENELIYSDLAEWPQRPFSAEALYEIVDRFDVTFILVSPEHTTGLPFHWTPYVQDTLLPAIHARPDKFALTWTSEDGLTQVYQVQR